MYLYFDIGDVPLHTCIREASDDGKPLLITSPDSPQVRVNYMMMSQ